METKKQEEILLELGCVFEKHNLTFGEIRYLLEAARVDVNNYADKIKLKPGLDK